MSHERDIPAEKTLFDFEQVRTLYERWPEIEGEDWGV